MRQREGLMLADLMMEGDLEEMRVDRGVLHALEGMQVGRVERGEGLMLLIPVEERMVRLFLWQMHLPNFLVAQEGILLPLHWPPLSALILWRIHPQSRQGPRPPCVVDPSTSP